jgi:hypothetical protein
MRPMVGVVCGLILACGLALPVAAQDDGVLLALVGAEVASVNELTQFETSSSDPTGDGESTVDQETLEEYAAQIFVGSLWTLHEDGAATFEYGLAYDLADFDIDEAQGVLTGTWTEKRNGELAVTFEYYELADDASRLVILGLTADVAVEAGAASAQVDYFQSVFHSSFASSVGDVYDYDLEIALEIRGEGGSEQSGGGPAGSKHRAEARSRGDDGG